MKFSNSLVLVGQINPTNDKIIYCVCDYSSGACDNTHANDNLRRFLVSLKTQIKPATFLKHFATPIAFVSVYDLVNPFLLSTKLISVQYWHSFTWFTINLVHSWSRLMFVIIKPSRTLCFFVSFFVDIKHKISFYIIIVYYEIFLLKLETVK